MMNLSSQEAANSHQYPEYPLVSAACRVLEAREVPFTVTMSVNNTGNLEPVLSADEMNIATERLLQGEISNARLLPEVLTVLQEIGVKLPDDIPAIFALDRLGLLPAEDENTAGSFGRIALPQALSTEA